jgi:hypothetical protein
MRAFILLTALGLFTASSQGQNLLTNGSFEAGNLTGWTGTGNLEVESNVPVSDGSDALVFLSPNGPTGVLSQTFATTVNGIYQLTYDYAATGHGINTSMVAGITDANAHALVETQSFPSTSGGAYRTHTAVFVATTPTMTVTFQDESSGSVTRDGLLDNVQVVAIPPFSRAGNYAGTVVESGSFYGGDITLSRTLAIKVQIDGAGQFFYFEVTSPLSYAQGTISDSGTATLGNDGLAVGTATFRGSDLARAWEATSTGRD